MRFWLAYKLEAAGVWALATGRLGGSTDMVVSGFDTREAATGWLLDYLVGIQRAESEAQLAAMQQMPLKVQ